MTLREDATKGRGREPTSAATFVLARPAGDLAARASASTGPTRMHVGVQAGELSRHRYLLLRADRHGGVAPIRDVHAEKNSTKAQLETSRPGRDCALHNVRAT